MGLRDVNLFLSYGRTDAGALAERLARDLAQKPIVPAMAVTEVHRGVYTLRRR